jgi:hypothetical protein
VFADLDFIGFRNHSLLILDQNGRFHHFAEPGGVGIAGFKGFGHLDGRFDGT